MKKHHFIKMSSIALSLCVALGTFPATAFADDANATTITKAYVDKATYAPGEAATIYVDVDGATGTRTAHIQITHLNETVWENDVTFTANGGKTTVPISWTPPTTDHQGYLVSITIDGKQIVTAIDVSSDVTTYPRYGYSVDFMPGETSAESDAMMKELAQVYHVNIVQYYDWMYRHEKILPDEGDEWVDMFGHTLSRQTIQQRIDAGHAYNQKAMAYQMSYMAREGYTENGVDPKWGLYSSQTNHNIDYNPSDNSTISGIDQYLFPLEGKPAPLLMTFNPLNTDWQNFMANQYKGAINTLDFDGIQIDQMGDFWGRDDENSVRLTNAAIAASGAMHIEMGSGMSTTANSGENFNDVSLLGNPYYPKAAKSMTSSLKQAMYNQYQFITAYENLLYDADVLPSDTGFQNISISNETISGDAKPGTIWYVIKNKGDDYGLIHLINLTGENDEDWRDVTGAPNAKQNLTVKYYIPQYKDISGVYCATPDTGCISNALAYNVQTDDVGKYVEIQVPSLEYWDMIYIRYNDNTLTDTVEAENSILTNVSTNNNHGGYSGTGFVDSYGKAGDAVTMDFFVPETGDYKLSFVYSAAVDGTPKRELYINAYGYDSISFPATSNWEEWNTSETTVHLRAGIQRMISAY